MTATKVRITIVLRNESRKLEREFYQRCRQLKVNMFMTDEAAEDFSQYELVGLEDDVNKVKAEFGK